MSPVQHDQQPALTTIRGMLGRLSARTMNTWPGVMTLPAPAPVPTVAAPPPETPKEASLGRVNSGRPSALRTIPVDPQEQSQPELVKQAAKVKARTRPWHAIIASALALIAAGVSYWFGHGMKSLFEPGHVGSSIAALSAAAAFFVFATFAVLAFARRARGGLGSVPRRAHAGRGGGGVGLAGAHSSL